MRHICRQSALTPRSQHEGAYVSIPFPAPQPGSPWLLLSFWLRVSYLPSPSINLWGKGEKTDVQGRMVGGVVRGKAGGRQNCGRSFCVWFPWLAATLWWTWDETHTWVGKQPREVLDLKKRVGLILEAKALGLAVISVQLGWRLLFSLLECLGCACSPCCESGPCRRPGQVSWFARNKLSLRQRELGNKAECQQHPSVFCVSRASTQSQADIIMLDKHQSPGFAIQWPSREAGFNSVLTLLSPPEEGNRRKATLESLLCPSYWEE